MSLWQNLFTKTFKTEFLILSTPHNIQHTFDFDSEKFYKIQTDHLANAILIDDYNPNVITETFNISFATKLMWINKGEVLSGSYIANAVAAMICGRTVFEADDIDIYFKSKEDAQEFVKLNNMGHFEFISDICAYGAHENMKFNLIYGVPYSDTYSLISRFDIRACAMAIDPTKHELKVVQGAVADAIKKRIVFNPVPRGTSIHRLIKYINKGFEIDKHQRLFFAELIRSNIYSAELELTTGY